MLIFSYMNETDILNDTTFYDLLNQLFPNDTSYNQVIENNTVSDECDDEALEKISLASLSISITCVVLVVVVYVMLAEYKRLHGKNVISLCISLVTSYLIDIIINYGGFDDSLESFVNLYIVSDVSYFATFLWIDILTYDTLRTVSRLNSESESSHTSKYRKYVIFVISVTLLLSVPVIVIGVKLTKYLRASEFENMLHFVHIVYYYVYTVFGVILAINVILFALLIIKLKQLKRQTAALRRKERTNFKLYIKLFFATGFTWIVMFVQFIYDKCQVYEIINIIQSFHGIFLFVIFICRKKMFKRIHNVLTKRSSKKSRQSSVRSTILCSNSVELQSFTKPG